MIKRYNEFLEEIEKISRTVMKSGKVNYDRKAFRESFFKQSACLEDNAESMGYIEYGEVKREDLNNTRCFGIKIKDTNILISYIIYFLERDKTCNIIIKKFPQLNFQEVEAAQRFITICMLSLQCLEGGPKIIKNDYFLKEIDRISKMVLESGKADYDREAFEKSFFYQVSHTPDNIESMKHIEYGEVKRDDLGNTRIFGIKIKDKDVLLSDIVEVLDNDEINNWVCEEGAEVTFEEIKAAQKVFRTIFRGLECREVDLDE